MKPTPDHLILQVRDVRGVVRSTGIEVAMATSFWSRLVGLLNRASLPDNQGLLLRPCTSIHTVGMRFSIDVIFLSRDGRVLGYADAVVPNRVRLAPRGTADVLEIAQGNRTNTGINLDDYVNFV